MRKWLVITSLFYLFFVAAVQAQDGTITTPPRPLATFLVNEEASVLPMAASPKSKTKKKPIASSKAKASSPILRPWKPPTGFRPDARRPAFSSKPILVVPVPQPGASTPELLPAPNMLLESPEGPIATVEHGTPTQWHPVRRSPKAPNVPQPVFRSSLKNPIAVSAPVERAIKQKPIAIARPSQVEVGKPKDSKLVPAPAPLLKKIQPSQRKKKKTVFAEDYRSSAKGGSGGGESPAKAKVEKGAVVPVPNLPPMASPSAQPDRQPIARTAQREEGRLSLQERIQNLCKPWARDVKVVDQGNGITRVQISVPTAREEPEVLRRLMQMPEIQSSKIDVSIRILQ